MALMRPNLSREKGQSPRVRSLRNRGKKEETLKTQPLVGTESAGFLGSMFSIHGWLAALARP